ncbi:hypothetical protein M3226_25215 [Neobacillus cucumis]|uniref:hypothetical protein n=1 Tax=Neobacillus cucumis TaxID=1740721 RepID=UPI0020421D19|nr:hypothetical protein [Neobacillus cucumis]MCM3728945.1 hypothetical protein [Neobacillus cucumis]
MKLDQNHPLYFDGRNLDQIAERIQEIQKLSHTVVVKPEIPEGTPVQFRYPHPLEEQYFNVSVRH